MSAPRALCALALAPLLAGCAAELGAHGGAAIPVHAPPRCSDALCPDLGGHWAGHIAASTMIGGRRQGLLVGGELEGHADSELGARWTSGFQLGYARAPERRMGAFGFEGHLDFGTPLREAALFPNGDLYAGATLAGVFWLAERRELADVNSAPWILTRVPELVIYARNRYHLDHDRPTGGDVIVRSDVGIGVALRVQIVSDLF